LFLYPDDFTNPFPYPGHHSRDIGKADGAESIGGFAFDFIIYSMGPYRLEVQKILTPEQQAQWGSSSGGHKNYGPGYGMGSGFGPGQGMGRGLGMGYSACPRY